MTRTLKVVAVAVALTAVFGGCRTMTGRSAGELMDNAATTASVKAKLTGDRLANLTWVDVDVNNGVVYLTGNAATPVQKQRATEVAMRANGVKQVVNNIVVNPSKSRTATSDQPSASSPSASPASAPMTAEVVSVDHGSGNVSLRMTDGSDLQLRLPPESLANVRAGDRVSVTVNPVAR
jgi:hypothetical protein